MRPDLPATQGQTEINRNRVFRHDPDQLYSEHDRERITQWNERVDSGVINRPVFVTSAGAYWKQALSTRPPTVCLAELYCTVQYDLARTKNEETFRTEAYTATEVSEWYSNIKDEETIGKYLDILVDIGILRTTRHGHYAKADEALGPVFETLARDGNVENVAVRSFPEHSSCLLPYLGRSRIPGRADVARSFRNEHLAGWVFVTNGVFLSTQLLFHVSRTGTVSTVDLGIAYLLTWLGLIGLIALTIGLSRRGFSTLIRLDRSKHHQNR